MDENNDRSLILAPDRSIADTGRRRILSMMVGETLALARQQQEVKPALSILVGDIDETMWECLEDRIRATFEARYTVKLQRFNSALDLLSEAIKERFTLSVVAVNNLVLPASNTIPLRVYKVVEFIRALKAAFKKPVIVLDGWREDANMRAKVELAGGDAYLLRPFGHERLLHALEQCLLLRRYECAFDDEPVRGWLDSFKKQPVA